MRKRLRKGRYTKRHIACGAPLWETFLPTLGNMPTSTQHMPDAARLLRDQGLTLDLCQYMGCGLVQFDCGPMDRYRDMIQTGGFSKTMAGLRRYQYKSLIQSCHLEGKRFIKVDCDQGEFLKVPTEFPVKARRIERDPHLVGLARAQGLDIMEGFTETKDTRFPGGLYDVFLSSDFPEHQPGPGTMLQAIYHNLKNNAVGLITVPSLEYIMDHNSYFELIRDHIAYYIFETLTPPLERNGFQMEECEVINRSTLSVIVEKHPQMDTENLLGCYVDLRKEMESYMKYLDAWDRKIAVWEISHQGFTLAATTKLEDKTQYIIDSAPFKHGKFAPSSHLPIVPPEYFLNHPVGTTIITAPGYAEEIAASIRERFGRDVEVRTVRFNHLELVGQYRPCTRAMGKELEGKRRI